tara:strand:+ start:109 stop:714 length:606 start_codon:yes stop_codon:yes gene_type:complete
MANNNSTGFGLIPVGVLGSTPATQGQGKYYIDAAYDKDLFQGTAVQSKVGYMKVGQNAITDLTIGVLNGIFYNASTTLKPTWANWYNQPITPANSEDITAFVLDNPMQLYMGLIDGAAAQAVYGKTYGLTTGDPTGNELAGQSTSKVIVAGVSATANSWRLIRLAEDPQNKDMTTGGTSVIVAQNLNQYLQNTGSAGVTWQ